MTNMEAQTDYLIKTYGFDQGIKIAFEEANSYLRMILHDRCNYESSRLNYDLRRVKERSETLYFEFCCFTGALCPQCGGSWNREAKTTVQRIFYCQLCFYEWPRTGKPASSPWLVIAPRTQKNI